MPWLAKSIVVFLTDRHEQFISMVVALATSTVQIWVQNKVSGNSAMIDLTPKVCRQSLPMVGLQYVHFKLIVTQQVQQVQGSGQKAFGQLDRAILNLYANLKP